MDVGASRAPPKHAVCISVGWVDVQLQGATGLVVMNTMCV